MDARGRHRGAKSRKARLARLKARRNRRLKYIAVTVLALLLIGDLLPLALADISPERPSGDFGIGKELQAVQDKRNSDKWENIIRSEAEGKLNAIDITHVDRPPVSIEEQVVRMSPAPPVEPNIFGTVEQTTLPNRTTLIEFLLNQPTSFYVFTRCNGHDKWSEGFLRPSLTFNPNGTLINWDKWTYVNVDDNNDTGDQYGNDVRARIDIQIDSLTPILPRLFPLPPTPGQLIIKGGIKLEVEKLSGPNATVQLPLELFIVKSYSYQGTNFLWMVGEQWKDMPNSCKIYLTANEFILQRPDFNPVINWTNPLNSHLFDTSNVINISSPYDIDVSMDTRPTDMDITVGYAKVSFMNLTERTWAVINFRPAEGLDRVPENIHLNLESPSFNKSFDKVKWTSTAPVNLAAVFKQVSGTTTYVELHITDMPTSLSLELNEMTGPHGEAATNVAYRASMNIKKLDYIEYEFYSDTNDQFTHSRLILDDVPKVLDLNGTFEIGGPDVPPPDNTAIGLPAKFMDNMMRKITGKFYRVAKTLRTIPDNIIHMPERKGFSDITVSGGESLGAIEFYVSSKSRVEANGDYIAFRNDSVELGGTNDPNLIGSSLSGRFTDIFHIYLDFKNGTILDMDLKEPRPLKILFIDDGNSARAVLDIDEVPRHFYLRFHPDTIHIQSDEPIDVLSYTSLVGSRYFRLKLEGLPTDMSIDQRGGHMVLRCAEGSSLGKFSMVVTDRERLTVPTMEYNHIFLDRSQTSYFTSIMLRDIRSLDMKSSAGGLIDVDFSKERDLYIDLTDTILDVQSRLLFSPFPSNFSIELPRGFTTSGIRLPNVLNVSSLFAFSPIILEMDRLAGDVLKMTTELTDNIAAQLGSAGSNTTIKMRSKVPTTLIGDLRKGPADDIRWVHGLNIAIDKKKSAVRGRIYMQLPLEASIDMRTDGDLMSMAIDFKNYEPLHEFLDVRVTGMADRDVALFLDGFAKTPSDLHVEATINANMTPGRGTVAADVVMKATNDLGPFFLTMRKSGEYTSIMTIYTSTVPKDLDLNANVSSHISVDWEASGTTKNIYVLMQKQVRDKWYDVTMTLNKVPTKLYVRVGPAKEGPLDMDGSLLQGLPEITVSGTTSSLSLYLYAEGPALGQPMTFEVRMSGITDDTTTIYDEADQTYKIRSQGLGYLYMRIIDMPFSQKLQVSEAEIYADEVYSADIHVDQAFGTLPIIDVSNLDVDTMQFRAHAKMDILGQKRNANIVFVDISLDGPLPRSAEMTKNGIAITGGDHHVIVPAPIATVLATLLGGG